MEEKSNEFNIQELAKEYLVANRIDEKDFISELRNVIFTKQPEDASSMITIEFTGLVLLVKLLLYKDQPIQVISVTTEVSKRNL